MSYKVGDKVVALVDWLKIKKGQIYKVVFLDEVGVQLEYWHDEDQTTSKLFMTFDEIKPANAHALKVRLGLYDKV